MSNRKFENRILGGFVAFLLVVFGVKSIDTLNPNLFKGALSPNYYGNMQMVERPLIRATEYVKHIKVDCDNRDEYQSTNCYYRLPLGFQIMDNTRMEIDNEKSDFCYQDQLNLVSCPSIYLKNAGSEKIYIWETGVRFKTQSKINIKAQRTDRYNSYDFSDFDNFQRPGRSRYTMVPNNRTLDTGNLRCQDYFYDVRKTNLRCGKITVLREMGIFTGQKNQNTRIPEQFRLPKANLDHTLKRAEFFVLADRMLNQSQYLRTQANLSLLEQFKDLDISQIYLKENTWWTQAAARLIEKGIMKGYSDSSLRPFDIVSEAEFAKVIANIRGANVSDAASGPWYSRIVDFWRQRGTYIEPMRHIQRSTAVDLMYEVLFL